MLFDLYPRTQDDTQKTCVYKHDEIDHFRVVFCLCVKTSFVRNHSYENELDLHRKKKNNKTKTCRGNVFSHERFCMRTRFEAKAQGNLKMAYQGRGR